MPLSDAGKLVWRGGASSYIFTKDYSRIMELSTKYQENVSRAADGTLRAYIIAAPIWGTDTRSTVTGNWHAATTWSGGVPAQGWIASIRSGHVVTLSQTGGARIGRDTGEALRVAAGGQLIIPGAANASMPVLGYISVIGTMTVTGTLSITDLAERPSATIPLKRRLELSFEMIGATQYRQFASVWKRNTVIDFYRKQTDSARVGQFKWPGEFDFAYDDSWGAYYKDIYGGRMILEES